MSFGTEAVMARGFGAAKRTLDGGDHSGSWDYKGKRARGFQSSVSRQGSSGSTLAHLPARAVGARHPVALLSRP